MIVVDASAYTAVVLGMAGQKLVSIIADDPELNVPEHFVVEVASALRGRWLGNKLTDREFATAMGRLRDSEFEAWPVLPLLDRMVELAANVSAYDAAYLALAEKLGATLITADARLAGAPGIRCAVDVLS